MESEVALKGCDPSTISAFIADGAAKYTRAGLLQDDVNHIMPFTCADPPNAASNDEGIGKKGM
jgi:hypothetical protein